MKLKNYPTVSVIIPTLNRKKIIVETLKYLIKQDYPKCEIIIVDQSDVPNIFPKFLVGHSNIQYFHLEEKGTPNAKNFGFKKSHGEILIFLDDDVRITKKNFIHLHVRNYIDPKVGAVGGRVLMKTDPPLKNIKEVGKFKFFGLKEITNFNANFRTTIDHVYGCNQSFLKKAFLKAGGFKKIFGGNAHLEEADLSFRIRKNGFKIMFDPMASLEHLHYPSGGCRVKNIYELRYWLVHNYTIFYLRNFNHWLFPLYLVKQIVWTIFSGLKRRDYKMFKTMSRALVDGYPYYKKIEDIND